MKQFFLVCFLCTSVAMAQNVTASPTSHTAVFYTKVLSRPDGLAVRGALDTGIVGLSFFGTWLLSAHFNHRVANDLEKSRAAHAVDSPFHVLGAAMVTALAVSAIVDACQSFISAVQQWYTTPVDIAGVRI